MPIENRELKVGTKLFARYRKQEYRAEVVEGEGGKRLYRLADGRTFKSPSAVGTAITGKACNGWMFWSVEEATSGQARGLRTSLPGQSHPPPPRRARSRRKPGLPPSSAHRTSGAFQRAA